MDVAKNTFVRSASPVVKVFFEIANIILNKTLWGQSQLRE